MNEAQVERHTHTKRAQCFNMLVENTEKRRKKNYAFLFGIDKDRPQKQNNSARTHFTVTVPMMLLYVDDGISQNA